MKKFRSFIGEQAIPLYPEIYCDMDEVLVDFIPYTNKLLKKAGEPPLENRSYWAKNGDEEFWPILQHDNKFWANIPPKKDKNALWNFIKPYHPNILSAVTSYMITCESGKREWLRKHITGVKKIHLVSRSEKKKYARSASGQPNLLIDDYAKNCAEWRNAGGVAIQHRSAKDTIRQLKKLGYK